MKIISLTLKNFKGIRSFDLDTRGEDVSISGDNATGKTTLFDAFLWLLFGKDSQNKKDFEIKTLDSAGKPITGIDHEVECIFEINGRLLTLKKSFKENWTKKRGSVAKEFTGHTTDHFIDGVPVQLKEYATRIDQIAKEDIFKLLTNPAFLNEQMKWQDRRKILLEVCGDISDEDVISSDASLSKLPDVLQGRKMEDHRKVIAARRKEINDQLDKIPVRIDEAERGLPELTVRGKEELANLISDLKTEKGEKLLQIARIENGGEVAEKTKALREVEGRLLDIKNKHRSEVDGKIQGKKSELSALNDKASKLQQAINSKQYAVQGNETSIKSIETTAARLREEWHSVNGREFIHNQECTCPTCGQGLPEEQLTAAREKALASFNREKSEKLEDITSKGKRHKVEIDRLKAEIETLNAESGELQTQLDTVKYTASSLYDEIYAMDKATTDITENPEYIKTVNEKQVLEKQIAELANGNRDEITEIRDDIIVTEAQIMDLEKELADKKRREEGRIRINTLKAQEKTLAEEFEKLEGELYLTEQFIRSKVAMLEERINSRFKYARFKLFDVQVNGGVAECCETLFGGVPYSGGLNNAARINVGLDIINTLSEHYGFEAPIFVDNAEAVTRLIETKGQIIKLVVSEQDKKLRVETEQNIMREAV